MIICGKLFAYPIIYSCVFWLTFARETALYGFFTGKIKNLAGFFTDARNYLNSSAGLEHRIENPVVVGSSPASGSVFPGPDIIFSLR
jgi:hypothetical protein